MLRGHWRYVGVFFALTLFTSVLEGIGFSLVVPLLQTMLSAAGEHVAAGGALQRALIQISTIIPPERRLGWLLGLLTLVFLVKSVGLVAASVLARWFVNTLRMNWISAAFLAYMRAPYSDIAARPHGEIVQNIIGETEVASRAILLLIQFAARSIQVTVLISVLLLADWRLTLFVILLGALGFGLFWRATQSFALDAGWIRQRIRQQVNDIVSECITGLRTIKLLDVAALRAERLRRMLHDYRRIDTKFEVISDLPTNTLDLVAVVFGTAVILFMTLALGTDIKEALPTMALFGLVLLRLGSTTGGLMNITTALPSLQTAHDMMALRPEQISGSAPFPGISGAIAFENVVLHPPGRQIIFDGLQMIIDPIGLTAIVGPSGSGKTTLVDLLVRLREPDTGCVRINGRDIRDFDLRSLRARVSYLSQEPQLFDGTVAENLRLGRPDVSEPEMMQAAMRAHAHEFISAMTEGYNTPLGRGAVTLSGGQRQRLALARELLRNPDLYIFDEPTSALDSEAEAVITQLMNELSRTHPVIIIAHRPDVILQANVVYRLEHGKAVRLSSSLDPSAIYRTRLQSNLSDAAS